MAGGLQGEAKKSRQNGQPRVSATSPLREKNADGCSSYCFPCCCWPCCGGCFRLRCPPRRLPLPRVQQQFPSLTGLFPNLCLRPFHRHPRQHQHPTQRRQPCYRRRVHPRQRPLPARQHPRQRLRQRPRPHLHPRLKKRCRPVLHMCRTFTRTFGWRSATSARRISWAGRPTAMRRTRRY